MEAKARARFLTVRNVDGIRNDREEMSARLDARDREQLGLIM